MVDAERTGFFGKVLSHGDFVARRLPPSFLLPWDAWVQGVLQYSRQELGERWLPTWLSSPIWRFALAPGVCGNDGVAGLMMPSVDRVGRQFPLTLAATVPGLRPFDCFVGNNVWFDGLEALALSSLREDFLLDAFDVALTLLAGQPSGGADIVAAVGKVIPIGGPAAQLANAVANAALSGHSLWWTDGSAQVSTCLLVCKGTPAPRQFAAMLDGAWREHGWEAG